MMISAVWALVTGSGYQSCRSPFHKFRKGEREGKGSGRGSGSQGAGKLDDEKSCQPRHTPSNWSGIEILTYVLNAGLQQTLHILFILCMLYSVDK